ncbi:MAG TPA: hypothetical protein VFM05_06165 [Candidatus Saccharimonadales bacterium]|nr:hypothetical protein [Candidatus Saccharimonadales bacterium]
MLPAWFVVFSVFIRIFSGGRYAWGVLRGKARPNPITWFLWGLTPMIALGAQLQEQGFGSQAIVLFALGLSPLVICSLTIATQGLRQHLDAFTLTCGGIAGIGIVLWQITDQPTIAIAFGILADIFATLPTLQKAYKDPSSEYAFPYLLSMVSMAIALLTIDKWVFAVYAFPLYMLCINVALFSFAQFPLRSMLQGPPKRTVAAKGKTTSQACVKQVIT